MQSNLITYISAIVLTVVMFVIIDAERQPPEAKPASAPENEFSGERAHNILKDLLQENQPHPVGSPLNRIVKQRIIEELSTYGIEAAEQQTWACATRFSVCAYVENIIAVIPGKSDLPYITLMSHYDSVPMAPGAGDDGAAVVAMLETARILKSEAPFNHPILLLFTDAEEMGLIGAEGFYKQHPLAREIGAVLDFEGSGTTGVSMVLRTSSQNDLLMNAFSEETSKPVGFSFANEIFKRMPNDTDFSVVQRANIPGIDFAFAAERNHYHTPNDNVENIDVRTIQHHGENMLPLVRRLATTGIEPLGSHDVYMGFPGMWIQWEEQVSVYLLLVSLALLGFAFVKLDAGLLGTTFATLGSLLIVLVTGLVCFLSFELIKLIQGTVVAWPASDLPYRFALFASSLTAGLAGIMVMNRYLRNIDTLIGVWFFWLILSVLMTIYLGDAANTVIVPTLAASAIIAAAALLDEKIRSYWLLLTLVFAVPVTLGMVLPLEQSQGYALIAATFVFLGLFNTTLIPLLHGAKLKLPFFGALAVTIVSIVVVISTPLYSEWRPQHLNINYFEDIDTGEAYYQLQSPNPVPDNLWSLMDFATEDKQLLPFAEFQYENWARTAPSGYPGPEVEVQGVQTSADTQTISVMIRSPRQADAMTLIFPGESKLSSFKLEGIPFETALINNGSLAGKYLIRIVDVYDRTISMELAFKSLDRITLYLSDKSTQLPDSAAALLEQRLPLASPVHQGDQAQLFKKVDLLRTN